MPNRIVLPVFLFLILIIWGCSDSSSPTNDNGDTTKPSTVQQTVGSNGGTIENSGMTIDIPEGLLAADTEIKLSETTETSFGDDAVTSTFTIEGIPETFSDNLEIKLKYEGEASDVIAVAVGQQYENLLDGEIYIFYDLVPAQVADGWIIAEYLPESDLIQQQKSLRKISFSKEDLNSKFVRYIKGVKDREKKDSANKHFRVKYHPFWKDAADQLSKDFENAFDTFTSMGMSFASKDNTWRGHMLSGIDIKEYGESPGHVTASLKSGEGYEKWIHFNMIYNEQNLGSSEDKRALMKHETGKMVFTMFSIVNDPDKAAKPESEWLLHALAEWAGDRMVADKSFQSKYMQSFVTMPLTGLHQSVPGKNNDSIGYGYGMSSLITYLDGQNNNDGSLVISILNDYADHGDAAAALVNNFSKPTNEVWPDFVQAYLNGDIYPIDTEALLGASSGSYTINSSSQATKPFTDTYGDLSAKIYKINLSYNEGDPDREFTFSTEADVNSEYLTILLYTKDSSGKLKLFQKGSEISINSLKEFISQETDELYAIVVNSACEPPYTETSSITLTISTEEKSDLPSAPIVEPNLIFVTIPGGSFDMGSEQGSTINQPVHRVRLDGFDMTQTEITNEQFVCFLNAALATGDILVVPYDDTDKTVYVPYTKNMWGKKYNRIIDLYNSIQQDSFGDISYSPTSYFTVKGGKNRHPVERVSWYGAVAFAEYYDCRLPTEAEWECACRAGTTTKFYTGDDDESVLDAAWCWDNTWDGEKRSTHPVGLKTPNNWGLYDMHGNVREWCNDHYNPRYYGESPEYNPTGPESGSSRVMRGGTASGGGLTSWSRDYKAPGGTSEFNGFRIVSD